MQTPRPVSARKDSRTRFFCLPARVVWTDPGSGNIENPEALLREDETFCRMTPGPGSGPAIVIDFGRELNGGISLDIVASHPVHPTRQAKIRLRFGESVSEVMGEPDTTHALHDLVLLFPGMARQEIGTTGFRFIRLDLLDRDNRVDIRQIHAVALERDWEYKGQFESSDPLLNQIWQIGARTVHLCCQDFILDGIKRDRLVWMGDTHPQVHVIVSAFGNIDIIPESLQVLRDRTPLPGWMNGISSYSLWWILSLWDWFLYSGDKGFLRSQTGYLGGLIDQILRYIDPAGREKLDARFLEWASARDEIAISEGFQALLVWAFQTASLISEELGEPALTAKCRSAIKSLRSPPVNPIASKHVNSLRVLAGMADAKTVNENCLALDPARGLSPWFGFYVLQARALAGNFTGCLDLIRQYWGGMLELGATTFWEHFDIEWTRNAARIDELTPPGKHDVHVEYGDHSFKGLVQSLCHGWSGGPTAWLSREVLGIRVLEPGFKKIRIEPHLGDLTFAKGTFPAPQGLIRVDHTRRSDGGTTSQYEVPTGVTVEER
jgi:alpha-L-rhamnosidase